MNLKRFGYRGMFSRKFDFKEALPGEQCNSDCVQNGCRYIVIKLDKTSSDKELHICIIISVNNVICIIIK